MSDNKDREAMSYDIVVKLLTFGAIAGFITAEEAHDAASIIETMRAENKRLREEVKLLREERQAFKDGNKNYS